MRIHKSLKTMYNLILFSTRLQKLPIRKLNLPDYLILILKDYYDFLTTWLRQLGRTFSTSGSILLKLRQIISKLLWKIIYNNQMVFYDFLGKKIYRLPSCPKGEDEKCIRLV